MQRHSPVSGKLLSTGIPRSRGKSGRRASGYWTVVGGRKKFSNVIFSPSIIGASGSLAMSLRSSEG
jgi:hypothetical protein